MTAIQVRNLSKTYGDHAAVTGLDLDVRTGEVFALLGPNGAGKTTTVEILEGFRTRDGGDVRVLGQDPGSAGPAWRDRVGVVLQSSTGLDLLTPREALRSTARAYRRPRDVDEVIDAVGLTEKANARVSGLSGGQRRRVDVALGIVGRPDVLFLDEPTTGFDPQARRDFWELIKSLAGEGTTIVLTTHYLDEAEHLADRVAVIAAGRLLDVASPAELGGRSARDAVVTWTQDGREHSESTNEPTSFVVALADRLGLPEIPGLTVTRPTLEDTYLAMIAPHVLTDTTTDRMATA